MSTQTHTSISQVIAKAIHDPDFRTKLIAEPKEKMQSHSVVTTVSALGALSSPPPVSAKASSSATTLLAGGLEMTELKVGRCAMLKHACSMSAHWAMAL